MIENLIIDNLLNIKRLNFRRYKPYR